MKNHFGHSILRKGIVTSTNELASKLLSEGGIEEGTVITAQFQSKGKGTYSKLWESEPGKNLTFSLVLYPTFLPLEYIYLISKIVALGLHDFLKPVLGEELKIKWPNDIYYKDKKLAGILIENSLKGNCVNTSVVGIGLNVNQEVFLSDAPNPVSVKQITGTEMDIEQTLLDLLRHLNRRYEQLSSGNYEVIDQDYHNELYLINQPHTFKVNGEALDLTIQKVSKDGKLVVHDDKSNPREFGFKEIQF